MRIGYTRTVTVLHMSTRVYNEPLPTYYVRKMMPDTELSQELMCLD